MASPHLLPSLTRISSLDTTPFTVSALPRGAWATGDYVACLVDHPPTGYDELELSTGRMRPLMKGQRFIGALGERRATLSGTGDWRLTGTDGRMHLLTSAGLMGTCSSKAPFLPDFLDVVYEGHVHVNGTKATMAQCIPDVSHTPFQIPTVLVTGTSMSMGKTTVAKTIIHRLKRLGARVLGAKLTGAGRYRDVQAMSDAGADVIFDFVDAGLPSTVCPPDVYRKHLRTLLPRMATETIDVAVIEIGASPLEAYNGMTAIGAIHNAVRCVALVASDPYAARGMMETADLNPDFVCGPATNTDAGRSLIDQLTGLRSLNVVDEATTETLDQLLDEKLGLTV
ncbi:MAG: hypothetical protein ACQETP_06160 [Bacteroidota bacterium]